jgi:replicative DNA helicase
MTNNDIILQTQILLLAKAIREPELIGEYVNQDLFIGEYKEAFLELESLYKQNGRIEFKQIKFSKMSFEIKSTIIVFAKDFEAQIIIDEEHLEILLEHVERTKTSKIKKQIEKAIQHIAKLIKKPNLKQDELLNAVTDSLLFPEQSKSVTKRVGVSGGLDYFKKIYDGSIKYPKTVKIGIESIDYALSGLGGFSSEGNLITVGGTSGSGKTVLACQIAVNSYKQGIHVLFISLEIAFAEIIGRILANCTKVPLSKILGADRFGISQVQREQIYETLEKIGDDIEIIDDPAITIDNIVGQIKDKVAGDQKLKIVIIDYIQLLRSKDLNEDRYIFLGKVSQVLRILSLKLKITIVQLVKLNRSTAANQLPTLDSIRESGEIAMTSDVVILMDKFRNKKTVEKKAGFDKKEIMFILEKNRNGRSGVVVKTTLDGTISSIFEDKEPQKTKSVVKEEIPFDLSFLPSDEELLGLSNREQEKEKE